MNAPFNPRTGLRDPFSAFLCDQAALNVVKGVAGDLGWSADRIHDGGLRAAVQSLAVMASPSVLLVDLADSTDPLEDINGLAEVCEPGTIVMACGTINDVRFYRELVNSGIHDYLLKPFTGEQLAEAVASAQAALHTPRAAEVVDEMPHAMIAVIGVRGGVGASTIATSLAWTLSDRHGRSSTLLDLDVHFGTGALALDLEPGRGLTDAMENPGRIDGLFIERALVRASEKLTVLSAEAPLNQPLGHDGTAFLQLQDELRTVSQCTVVDLPRGLVIQHPMLVRDATVVVVVTELTLAATRDAIRILSWLKSNAPQARVVVVANKVPAGGTEIQRKDFEKSIECAVDHQVTFEPKLAQQAAKLGKPVAEVAKQGKARPVFDAIADSVAAEEGGDGKAKGRSLVGRIGDLGTLIKRKPKA